MHSRRHTALRLLIPIGLFSFAGLLAAPLAEPLPAARHTTEEIIVNAGRIDKPVQRIPQALSVVSREDIQPGRQQLGLDESLARVPGLFFQNRYNFAQDLRIAMRGFGARANFGIRGIKVFVDGIPSTLADGQSGVDDIDLGAAARIEVMRGPSSSLYGSAAGGVISIHTETGPKRPFIEAGLNFGDFDQQKYQLKAGGQYERLNYLLNVSHLALDGHRQHARLAHTLFNSKWRYQLDPKAELTLIVNAVDSPIAEDPGALNEAAVANDRRQAQVRNVRSNAGEELAQQKLGLVYKKSFGDKRQLLLRNYYTWRDFDAFLPLGTHIPFAPDDGAVALSRFFFGGGGQYSHVGTFFSRANRFVIGFDIDRQQDERQRFVNKAGVRGGLSFDQVEQAAAYGVYVRNELAFTDRLEISVGGRYDRLALSLRDRFLPNGDQSSKVDFDEFSPMLGISWRAFETVHLYANYSLAFETPTFSELANPARNFNLNLGGFNNVKAQTAESFEVGIKGKLARRIYLDIAAFAMQVEDEITGIGNIGNRAFFENADTRRRGLEAMLVMDMFKGLKLSSAYTWSDFEFERLEARPALAGKTLPGIPAHQFYLELAWRHDSGAYLIWDLLLVDALFVNNANSVRNPAYKVANLRLGHELGAGKLRLAPYLGINNLFNEKYNANTRLNAFGGRFFEPAPRRHFYGGIRLRYRF